MPKEKVSAREEYKRNATRMSDHIFKSPSPCLRSLLYCESYLALSQARFDKPYVKAMQDYVDNARMVVIPDYSHEEIAEASSLIQLMEEDELESEIHEWIEMMEEGIYWLSRMRKKDRFDLAFFSQQI